MLSLLDRGGKSLRRRASETRCRDDGDVVHEAYLKLVAEVRAKSLTECNFIAVASRVIAAGLVDYARE